MTRTQKIVLFTLLATMSLIAVGTVVYEMAAPRIARGTMNAPPVTAMGWLQLSFSTLATVGFSVAVIWQTVVSFIEVRLPGVIHSTPPLPASRTQTAVVDVTKLTAFLVLIRQVTDDGTKVKLTEAARMACDNLRDELFPFPEPGKG